jgi:hypothetical protein
MKSFSCRYSPSREFFRHWWALNTKNVSAVFYGSLAGGCEMTLSSLGGPFREAKRLFSELNSSHITPLSARFNRL